jgi:4Fe-4S ferredoxin
MTKAPGFLYPVVDANRCEGKGPCIDVCPVNVFTMGVLPKSLRSQLTLKGKLKGFAHQWKQALVTDPAACEGCGLCVSACPENAIKLAKTVPENIA